nr:hypothetical protein Iba_chr04bCG0270 [Ipomoea batatas]GMD48941.1 hypothetical protein Iba_chr10fCG11110 [Ipomoea batatas]GME16181.1 hypothetical protein Iba_scaffold17159.3CG0300 [Ipomoea batatas]
MRVEGERSHRRREPLATADTRHHHWPSTAPIAGVTTSVTGQRRATNRRPNRSKYKWQ